MQGQGQRQGLDSPSRQYMQGQIHGLRQTTRALRSAARRHTSPDMCLVNPLVLNVNPNASSG